MIIASVIGYGLFLFIHKSKYQLAFFFSDVKTAIFLTSTLLFLTPVLKSLTVSYSDDTIILIVVSKKNFYDFNSLMVVFIIFHLALYDYSMVKRQVVLDNMTQSVGSPLSLNAVFFAAILLSSRLEKFRHVYVLLFLSMV